MATDAPLILLLEDETEAADLLAEYLRLNGYRVAHAADGLQAVQLLPQLATQLDLAILDIMVPGLDGRQVLGHIRSNPHSADIPVLFLTAKDQEQDEIQGLSAGADDYIAKPAGLSLVLARVRNLLRRRTPRTPDVLAAGNLRLYPDSHEAWVGERRLDLTASEYQLLLWLARHPTRVFSRAELLETALHDDIGVLERTVDVHIKNLRLKLGEAAELIRTVRGVGYGLDPNPQP